MEVDFFPSDTFKSFKDVKAKLENVKIWDFSWINLLRIDESSVHEKKPVYINKRNKLIFEPEKMKVDEYYEVQWEKMNLLLKKEKDCGIIFYEILDEENKKILKQCLNERVE